MYILVLVDVKSIQSEIAALCVSMVRIILVKETLGMVLMAFWFSFYRFIYYKRPILGGTMQEPLPPGYTQKTTDHCVPVYPDDEHLRKVLEYNRCLENARVVIAPWILMSVDHVFVDREQ